MDRKNNKERAAHKKKASPQVIQPLRAPLPVDGVSR
jgi:hypothetical protein